MVWLKDIDNENFLAIYDILLDIEKEVNILADEIIIPSLQTKLRFRILCPIDTPDMRDKYMEIREKAVIFLRKKDVIENFELIEYDHRWQDRLKITIDKERFKAVLDEMKEEFEKRKESMDVEEIISKRKMFLKKLYELTVKSEEDYTNLSIIAKSLEIPKREAMSVAKFLKGEGYLDILDRDGTIKIENPGVNEVEKSSTKASLSNENNVELLEDKIFIVHGHDIGKKEMVARFLEKLDLKAIILHEQPNKGQHIMEKLESYAEVRFAIILLTPDDIATSKDMIADVTEINKLKSLLRPRARQNVIFELGFFIGKLERSRVCVLYTPDVEIPSDFKGILYIEIDSAGAWKQDLIREMKVAGIQISADQVF